MTTDQQLAYWRSMARKHEATVKSRSDYDQLKEQAAEATRLRQERETDTEKQIREAREQARTAAAAELAPRLVEARFAAAAAGRIAPDRLVVLTEDIDLTRYLTATGEVDLAKVEAKVAAWAPPGQPAGTPRPDPTQGARNSSAGSGTDVGREMFAARRKRPTAT